jgi:hypothetical protein
MSVFVFVVALLGYASEGLSQTLGDDYDFRYAGFDVADSKPTIPQPHWMSARDRELFDAIVFDAYSRPDLDSYDKTVQERSTFVLSDFHATNIEFCIQSPEESHTGERLVKYQDVGWWRRQISDFTGLRFVGRVKVDVCKEERFSTANTRDPKVLVRESSSNDGGGFLARTSSVRSPGGVLLVADIYFHKDRVESLSDDKFEDVLIHELGHVLGFYHAPPDSGFVMSVDPGSSHPYREHQLTQLAYRVGTEVEYPGVVPTVPTLPFLDSLINKILTTLDIRYLN